MIKAIGDSHAEYAFKNIPGVFTWWIAPVTLKRVGYKEDTIVQEHVNRIGAAADDLFLFVFGEIDVRAYVKPWHERHKDKMTLDEMLGDWAHRYADALADIRLNGARRGIVSIVPPASTIKVDKKRFPVAGAPEERAEYTRIINRHLADECAARDWPYIDIYSLYADEKGMLPDENRINMHVKDNAPVRKLMTDLGLVA